MYKAIGLFILFSFATLAQAADPTKPFSFSGQSHSSSKQAVREQQKLVLEAIIHARGIHTAVINNRELQVGDRIGAYRLVAVNDASVVLRSKEEKLVLKAFTGVLINKR